MSSDAVGQLRQRMIEDMNSRKLGAAHAEKTTSTAASGSLRS